MEEQLPNWDFSMVERDEKNASRASMKSSSVSLVGYLALMVRNSLGYGL